MPGNVKFSKERLSLASPQERSDLSRTGKICHGKVKFVQDQGDLPRKGRIPLGKITRGKGRFAGEIENYPRKGKIFPGKRMFTTARKNLPRKECSLRKRKIS